MSTPAKVGDVVHSHFSMYEADGTTKRAGASADASVTLLLDLAVADEVAVVTEVSPGEYAATFTPTEVGTYTVIVRDTVRLSDYVESFVASESSLDDVAAAVATIAAHDSLVNILGIEGLRAAADWTPTILFLRRSTMTPIDPDSIATVEVLGGDGEDIIETILGGDLVRTALGRFRAAPEQLASAGSIFIRVTFTYLGVDVVDVARIYAAPARGVASGSAGSAASLARIYTCPTFLTEAQFDLGDRTPQQVWQLIQDVSAQIETMTNGNIFNGEYGEYACSGRARRIIYHPHQIPFCKVDLVELDGDRTDHSRDGLFRWTFHACGVEAIAASRYTLRAGMVESIHRDFPQGALNVTVTGAIGSPQPAHYAATLSASAVGADSDSVDVEDVEGFQARDVVELLGATSAIRVIVTSIDVGLGRLFFDAVGGTFDEIEIGAVVRTFGQVPRPITLVANYLFGVAMREQDANAAGDEFIPAGRVKRERTDNYEIEFQIGSAADSLTGSPRYDRMLYPYMKPIDVRFP